MPKTTQADQASKEFDDSTPEEIQAVKDFANEEKILFKTPEEAIKWLHEFKE